MADRFYGYQYGTNPRKLNSEYVTYKNRYPKKEEPVRTTNKSQSRNTRKNIEQANRNRTNRVQNETHKNTVQRNGRKQVVTENRAYKSVVNNNLKNEETRTTNNVQNVKATKVSTKAKLKIVMFLIASFSVLFAISYQNSLINESFNRKEQYKKEAEALNKTNQQIEVSIENNLNLNNIEQAAKEKIGMQKLSNDQKIYVSLPKEDYVAPAAEQIVMEEETGFFQKIFNAIFK